MEVDFDFVLYYIKCIRMHFVYKYYFMTNTENFQ